MDVRRILRLERMLIPTVEDRHYICVKDIVRWNNGGDDFGSMPLEEFEAEATQRENDSLIVIVRG